VAYKIAGTYVATCNCAGLCPCPVDQRPSTQDGTCSGVIVFDVRAGNLDGADLSGTRFALYNYFPSNITAGNWKVGIYVDEGASDEQASAIERIVSGQEGGPFADFAGLIGEYTGMERASVTFGDGDEPSAGVGGSRFSFSPFKGGDGSPTKVKNAMFGFAPEYAVGTGSGTIQGLGVSFDPSYGETAEYEFSSEAADVHLRA
jgi:hypothetical protein